MALSSPSAPHILDHLMFTVMDELRYTCKYQAYLGPATYSTFWLITVYMCAYIYTYPSWNRGPQYVRAFRPYILSHLISTHSTVTTQHITILWRDCNRQAARIVHIYLRIYLLTYIPIPEDIKTEHHGLGHRRRAPEWLQVEIWRWTTAWSIYDYLSDFFTGVDRWTGHMDGVTDRAAI